MAYDKVVDSAQLDGALTATADAIRGKTGETAPIPWDAETGFAAAIAAIAAGGGNSSGIGVESGVYIPNANARTFEVEVSQQAHDNCLFMACTANKEDLEGLVSTDNAAWSIWSIIHESTYVGDAQNAKRYITPRVLWPDSIAMNAGINNFFCGVYIEESKVIFGCGAALAGLKAGIEYTWHVYYSKEASA